jgi:nicotinate-nucleotide adenylyltransferase
MRLGLFGGTFDPVHYGHLLLAECCREQARLDEVWFLPAAVPPHKQNLELTPARERIEMLELAIGGHEPFSVCKLEVERGGVSYTVDTLQQLHEAEPARELFFLLGADMLHDLPNWREPARVCELALPLVVRRPGSPTPDFACLFPFMSAERLELCRSSQVTMPQVDLSSSEIRHRVAEGRSIRFQTPRAVEKYVESHRLYGSRKSEVGDRK